jgi:hypothetical protein
MEVGLIGQHRVHATTVEQIVREPKIKPDLVIVQPHVVMVHTVLEMQLKLLDVLALLVSKCL